MVVVVVMVGWGRWCYKLWTGHPELVACDQTSFSSDIDENGPLGLHKTAAHGVIRF